MKHQRTLLLIGLTLLLVCLFALDVWAGPGGKIAKAVFTTFWGKILLFFLVILLLPVILYAQVRQYFKTRSTMKALRQLAAYDRKFDWLFLKNRFTDIFTRTHAAWGQEDMGAVSEFSTSWYCQNQQIVHLDRWQNQGLINKSQLNKINSMSPIFVRHSGEPNGEGSIVVVDFRANVEDYLMKRDSGIIVEGKKGFQNVETLWSFQLQDGKWLLENIEQVDFWSMYIKMPNEVPAVALQPKNI
jgi:hypothetical protein